MGTAGAQDPRRGLRRPARSTRAAAGRPAHAARRDALPDERKATRRRVEALLAREVQAERSARAGVRQRAARAHLHAAQPARRAQGHGGARAPVPAAARRPRRASGGDRGDRPRPRPAPLAVSPRLPRRRRTTLQVRRRRRERPPARRPDRRLPPRHPRHPGALRPRPRVRLPLAHPRRPRRGDPPDQRRPAPRRLPRARFPGLGLPVLQPRGEEADPQGEPGHAALVLGARGHQPVLHPGVDREGAGRQHARAPVAADAPRLLATGHRTAAPARRARPAMRRWRTTSSPAPARRSASSGSPRPARSRRTSAPATSR